MRETYPQMPEALTIRGKGIQLSPEVAEAVFGDTSKNGS